MRNRQLALGSAALLAAGLGLLLIARKQWFWLDEWDFLALRSQAPLADVLEPHNEHLTALPLLAYRLLFRIFGLHSYLPYYAFFVAVLLVAAMLLYQLLRTSGVPLAPSCAGVVLWLFLGSGAENVLWAWQIGLIGSMAFYLGALLFLLVRPPGTGTEWRVVALLIGALLCSGIGVMAVAGVTAAHALRNRSLVAGVRLAAVPAVAYVLWFLTYGRGAVRSDLSSSLPLVSEFVLAALSAGLAGLAGVPASGIGPALAVVFVLGCAAAVVRHGEPPVASAASVVTLGAFLGSSAALRAGEQGISVAATGRYVHVSGALLLLIGLPLLFRTTTGVVRSRMSGVAASLLLAAGLSNLLLLVVAAKDGMIKEQAIRSRVELGAALLASGADGVSTARPQAPGAPALTVQGLRELMAQGAVSQRRLDSAPPVEVAEALTAIQVDVVPSSGVLVAVPLDLTLEPSPTGALATDRPGCRTVTSPGGVHPVYSYRAAGTVSLSADAQQQVRIYHGETRDFAPLSFRDATLSPGAGAEVRLASPRTGIAFLRLDIAPGSSITLCSA